MKIKNILIFIIVLTTLFLITITPISAKEITYVTLYDSIIQENELDVIILDGDYTWKEYIDQFQPNNYEYCDNQVYFNGGAIYLYAPILGNKYVSPNSSINQIVYLVDTPCDHDIRDLSTANAALCKEFIINRWCNNCNYKVYEVRPASIEHDYQLEIETYIPGTCGKPGYALYKCVNFNCGLFYTTEVLDLDPNNHFLLKASCEAPPTCRDCGMTFGEALGHELNILGNCTRDNCDFNVVSGYITDKKESFNQGLTNIVSTIVSSAQNTKDKLTDSWEGINTTLNNVKQTFDTAIMFVSLLFGLIIFVLFYRIYKKIKSNLKGRS